MAELTPEAIKLLRKVKKHILAEPRRFGFGWLIKSDEVPCGTKACIAGWTIILGKKFKTYEDANAFTQEQGWSKPAAELLNITPAQASALFIWWPAQFKYKETAECAAKRIEFFIKTKGTDIAPVALSKRKKSTKIAKQAPLNE